MAVCIALTLWAVADSHRIRGYEAIGGEYLIIPLGLVLSYVVIKSAETLDRYRAVYRRRIRENRKHNSEEYKRSLKPNNYWPSLKLIQRQIKKGA